MKYLNSLLVAILCFWLYSCNKLSSDNYAQCRKEVEIINQIPLYVAYLVPVDSLGKYVNDEIISSDMYNHCELITDSNKKEAHIFATLYFDNSGIVRKTIRRWSDGGDLNRVAYYNKQGKIIYAVSASGEDNHGKLYSDGESIMRVEYSFSEPRLLNDFLSTTCMTTENIALDYKANLQIPDNCRSVTFSSIKKGDQAFFCANQAYTEPNGNIINTDNNWFGRTVSADTVINNWCRIRTSITNELIGYVSVDSLELIR